MITGKAQFQPGALVIPAKPKALFLPYQEGWIKDNSKIKAMEKSRQIGISWATAYRRVRQKSLDTERYDDWISSRDDIQARLFLEDCKSFAALLNKAAKDLGERVYNDETGKPFTAYTLEFNNALRIHSMSSNPDAQAGKRGSRVFDEFPLHKDPRKLYAIGKPGITWGGQMEIISTHRGSHNFFNREIVEDAKGKNKKRISLHTVTLQDALEQGFLWKLQMKLAEPFLSDGVLREDDLDEDTYELLHCDESTYFDIQRAEAPDEESFQQEYMCVPSDDATAFLSYEMIDSCCYNLGEDWELDLARINNPLYVGVDIGRDHDLTVIWVVEKVSDVYLTRKIVELKAMRFSEQEKIFYEILKLSNVRRCCIDQTGIGRQFAEHAEEQPFGGYRVEGITFTQNSKEEMAYPVRAAFEDRAVRIPKDEKITSDLRSIKKETVGDKVRFSADRGKNGHADRFWALALALHAGKDVAQKFHVTSATGANKPKLFNGNGRLVC